jgi:hypothetical protein
MSVYQSPVGERRRSVDEAQQTSTAVARQERNGILTSGLKAIVVSSLLLTLPAGCASGPRAAGSSRPALVEHPLNHAAWLRKVEIPDRSVANRATLEESLTLTILERLEQSGDFRAVNALPGKPGNHDYVFRFQFDEYRLRRSIHPAYYPCAILTMTLYIWFGGPIANDTASIAGRLTVEDASGSPIVQVSSKSSCKESVSFWSPQFYFPGAIKARNLVIQDLLAKSTMQLHLKEGEQQ